MAEYVTEGAREIEGIEVRSLLVADASLDDLRWADGIALGSPTYVGLTSWRMKRFWDEASHKVWGEMDGKIGCAFSSSGGWGGGSELACMSGLTMMMNLGMLTFGVTDYVGRRFTLHHGAITAGEPRDEADIEACRRLGKRLAQWVAVFFDGRSDAHPGPIRDRS
jgi:NAD(P)H dehydrogenase (quinone)